MKKFSAVLLKHKKIIIAVLIIMLLAVFTYKIADQSKIDVSFYRLTSDKVSDNIRIVALSDLHMKEFGDKNSELVAKIRSLAPDVIACTGDMTLSDNDDYGVVTELCSQMTEIAPVFFCYGNTEWSAVLAGSKLGEDLKAVGVHVLSDASEVVTIKNTKLNIAGLSQGPEQFDKYGGRKFIEKYTSENYFKLLLVHYPEEFLGHMEDYPIDLALCGHAHGGQVRLPFIGGLYSTGQGWFPKLTEGCHKISNSTVIVSRGLGNSHKTPRLNNPPELVVVDIGWY